MRHASVLRERSYFSPCGGGVEGARSACVALAGDAWVVSDVAKGMFEGAPSIAFGIGTTAWTGAFGAPADVTAALATLDAADVVDDVRAAISWVAEQHGVRGDRVGIVGFCYGGGVAWRVLTQEPRLRVGVPFYGPAAGESPRTGRHPAALELCESSALRSTRVMGWPCYAERRRASCGSPDERASRRCW